MANGAIVAGLGLVMRDLRELGEIGGCGEI